MYRWGWTAAFVLLLLGGCAEETSVAAGTAPPGNATVLTPDLVLDGTELLPLAEVRRAALPPSPAGDYRAEPGGAEINVSITRTADGAWSVTRVYREPGLAPQTSRYQAHHSGGLLVAPGDGLKIQGTEEGILVLESTSGVEFIPPDFWIHYGRVEEGP